MSVINTNVKALAAQESMRSSSLSMSQAMERLSTGKKINSAKDDAAGLAITNRMTSQIRGFAKAIQNTNDAISMSQTAEGAMGNVGDILQRMRELTVQAATGTNSNSDRTSLQLEVSQLKQQIQDIASKTNHNNIKLLDGTAQNVVIQTGTNAGDNMKIGFDSLQTKDIGIGSKAVVSSVGGSITNNLALTAGSLLLNGVAVGASLATDDSASSGSPAMSAIAKAAAINRVSDLSGVYAKVDSTTVSGAAMTAVSATGYVTINGVQTDYFATSTDNSLARKTVVQSINAKTAITGVVAIDTGDDNLGVTLLAKDGRNITVAFNTHTTGSIGLAGADTYVGSYTLYTLDGRDINVSAKTGPQDVAKTSGLTLGTYKSDTALFTTYSRTMVATAPASSSQGLMNANSMVINGFAVRQALATDDTASDTTATASTRAASAIAIAAAINASSDKTGVTATAAPNVLRSTSYTATLNTSSNILLNGVTMSVNGGTRNGLIDSINSYSSRTGVVASAWGDSVQLSAADGRNISMTGTAGATLLAGITMGADSNTASTYVTNYSQVTLSSSNAFTVQSGSNGITNLENLGFRQGTFGGSDNGLKINQVDVSTVSGANQALFAIDAAINTVSAAQAKSGAFNNRLDTVVNNLTESTQNMQASRSRILDTDYATETTNLAKQQIIQQAATAMLAQANQSSQNILSLLK